jgi:hypothetical protein
VSVILSSVLTRKKASRLRFEVLTEGAVKITVFWTVTPCGLVEVYQCFGTYYHHLHGAKHSASVIKAKINERVCRAQSIPGFTGTTPQLYSKVQTGSMTWLYTSVFFFFVLTAGTSYPRATSLFDVKFFYFFHALFPSQLGVERYS